MRDRGHVPFLEHRHTRPRDQFRRIQVDLVSLRSPVWHDSRVAFRDDCEGFVRVENVHNLKAGTGVEVFLPWILVERDALVGFIKPGERHCLDVDVVHWLVARE